MFLLRPNWVFPDVSSRVYTQLFTRNPKPRSKIFSSCRKNSKFRFQHFHVFNILTRSGGYIPIYSLYIPLYSLSRDCKIPLKGLTNHSAGQDRFTQQRGPDRQGLGKQVHAVRFQTDRVQTDSIFNRFWPPDRFLVCFEMVKAIFCGFPAGFVYFGPRIPIPRVFFGNVWKPAVWSQKHQI